MKEFIQNHPGQLSNPPKKLKLAYAINNIRSPLKKLPFTVAPIILVFLFVVVMMILELPINHTLPIIVVSILGLLSIVWFLYNYYYVKNELTIQQKKYYKWGNVKPLTQKQLEAMQLVAFSRYSLKSWTDSIEHRPIEHRVKHIKNYKKKLDWLNILTSQKRLESFVDSWGVSTKEKYYKMYHSLIEGHHTPLFMRDFKEYPNWKDRVLELTDLPEDYFDACMNSNNQQPPKLIWAWDLWRAISITTTAFESELISEEEAWGQIYKASDIAHYMFDNIEDFLNNSRLGHAYWCNDNKQAFERKTDIEFFLNPKKENLRQVHSASWTKPNTVELPSNMKDGCENYLKELNNESDAPRIGFKKSDSNQEEE